MFSPTVNDYNDIVADTPRNTSNCCYFLFGFYQLQSYGLNVCFLLDKRKLNMLIFDISSHLNKIFKSISRLS